MQIGSGKILLPPFFSNNQVMLIWVKKNKQSDGAEIHDKKYRSFELMLKCKMKK